MIVGSESAFDDALESKAPPEVSLLHTAESNPSRSPLRGFRLRAAPGS
jgi:hypothetical protein